MSDIKPLEDIAGKEAPEWKRTAVDSLAKVSYGLLLGGFIDCRAGKSPIDTIATRGSSIAVNAVTGRPRGGQQHSIV
ncbi:MAG TPA: hypothetical protein VJH88_05415 [Candidatus Nanoarchaeia archaeon]|nr:hypothetical protein [Candidatus Nanoarchaeia archaeon]